MSLVLPEMALVFALTEPERILILLAFTPTLPESALMSLVLPEMALVFALTEPETSAKSLVNPLTSDCNSDTSPESVVALAVNALNWPVISVFNLFNSSLNDNLINSASLPVSDVTLCTKYAPLLSSSATTVRIRPGNA